MEVISIKDLVITNKSNKLLSNTLLLEHIDLSLNENEILGIVGESGSGKTMLLRSIMGLLPEGIEEKFVKKQINGKLAMIFQNPMSALDPLCPVSRQLEEIFRFRQGLSKRKSKEKAEELLYKLGFSKEVCKEKRLPGELSGGQCQRILIAMALACQPDILLCDEPTTALDVTVQKKTLELIRSLQREMQFSIIFVTHNLAVAADICDRLAVMYDGRIVETGSKKEILCEPRQEYTKKLLSSILHID